MPALLLHLALPALPPDTLSACVRKPTTTTTMMRLFNGDDADSNDDDSDIDDGDDNHDNKITGHSVFKLPAELSICKA